MGLNLDRPGFFPDTMINQMIDQGMIRSESDKPIDRKKNVQSSTFQPTISDKIGSFVLEKGKSETVPLNESLWLPTGVTPVHDTRSTYGKVDVGAVLVNEDGNPISRGYQGELFAKIESRWFKNIRVPPGLALNQIRFRNGEMEECMISASELAADEMHVHYDDDHGYVIMMGIYLKNREDSVSGYVALDTDEVLDLAGGNPKDSFFREIGGCVTLNAENRLYLYWTKEKLAFRDVEEPFVCEMLRKNPTGKFQVNGAGLIEYGSWCPPSRKALEIRPPEGYVFNNGGGICFIKCYSLLGTPEGRYGPPNGNMNLTRLLPSIIID